MERVDFSNIRITGEFWAERKRLIKEVTAKAVYERFKESGRIDAFACDKESGIEPHIFWDSDVVKWIEGVSYLLMEERNPEVEEIIDQIADEIEKNRLECGYFNSYHITKENGNHFFNRDWHELYCLGHLIEASIAYCEATKKDKLLRLACDYADYVERRFKIDKDTPFTTPGHEEIELALVRLYEYTGKKNYLDLAVFFVEERGKSPEGLESWMRSLYNQSHKPPREQHTAEGHAVRAVYFYSAMADIARKCGDVSLKEACERIFDDIYERKMYITGGIGSSRHGEAFTVPYDLPNDIAYTETCASIGLAFFAHRMLLLEANAKYADAVERAIYNGALSGISLDGKHFFYTNPLQVLPYMRRRNISVKNGDEYLPITERVEEFVCSCCPPNIVRLIPSIGNFLYTREGNTVYAHQFMDSVADIALENGKVTIRQETDYPYDGRVKFTVTGGRCRLAIRIPQFAEFDGKTDKGYSYFDCDDGECITLDFKMKPYFVEANPCVTHDCGKYAVVKGPLVYCMESVDNGDVVADIRLDLGADFKESFNEELGVPTLEIDGYRRLPTDKLYSIANKNMKKVKATLIPYFAFANRGECEMQVWNNIILR